MGLAEFEKERPIVLPPSGGSNKTVAPRSAQNGWVSIKPNPASDYVIVSFDLQHLGDGNVAVFEIVSPIGKPLLSQKLETTIDEVVVDLKGLNAGSYMYRVMFDGHVHYTGKFVVLE
jgi:hypothetical protein